MRRMVFAFLVTTLLPCLSLAEDIYILGARGNPYWQILATGTEETSKQLAVDSVVYFLSADAAAEEQLNVCQVAIQRKPRLLGVAASNSAIGIKCLKEALSHGVEVAVIDASITEPELKNAQLNIRYSVGSDNYSIGAKGAEYIAKKVTSPNPKLLLLKGAPGSRPGKERIDGFQERIKQLVPGTEIVGSVNGNWDRMTAMSITADFALRYPTLDLIFAANDVMALGAAEATRTRPNRPLIISVDGTKDAREAVSSGKLTATVAQLPYLIGKRAVELAQDRNLPQNHFEVTETPVLDRELLANPSDKFMLYVR